MTCAMLAAVSVVLTLVAVVMTLTMGLSGHLLFIYVGAIIVVQVALDIIRTRERHRRARETTDVRS